MNRTSHVSVVCGANSYPFDGLAGKPVGAVPRDLTNVIKIPQGAQIFVNGKSNDGTRILQPGDQAEFVMPSSPLG